MRLEIFYGFAQMCMVECEKDLTKFDNFLKITRFVIMGYINHAAYFFEYVKWCINNF